MEGELLLLAAGALALYLAVRHGRRSPRIQRGSTVALFGDSLAQGLAGPLRDAFAMEGVQLVADTQPGTRLDQWVDRGPQMAAGASYALISLGTNDALANAAHRAGEAAWAKNISDRLRQAGVTPIWLLPPPMTFDTYPESQAIRATGDRTLPASDYPRYDGLHPTPAGFRAWAQAIVTESMR